MEEIMLPPRMFAAGDEPIAERVNSYHKLKTTRKILDALEPEELEFIRNSTFGRIIAIDEQPPFSGAFGQHAAADTQEFAIVTGLNCGKIPVKKKKKNQLKEKLYWNELFGSLKFCSVETAIDMLKDKVVKTTQLIRDLDAFLAFPWGRASYQILASSLSGKDEIALSQSSFALRGYVEAIQLIMVAAIPQLKEEVAPSERVVIVDSETEGETPPAEDTMNEDDNVAGQGKTAQATKYCLIPGHAKSIDSECQAMDTKLEKLVPHNSQPQQIALLQSTMSQFLHDLDKKISDSIWLHLKDMQEAIIKGVCDVVGSTRISIGADTGNTSKPSTGVGKEIPPFDYTTQSEDADNRISEVLRYLNIVSDVSIPASTEACPEPLVQEGAEESNVQPGADQLEKQLADHSDMEQFVYQVGSKINTVQGREDVEDIVQSTQLEQQVDGNTNSADVGRDEEDNVMLYQAHDEHPVAEDANTQLPESSVGAFPLEHTVDEVSVLENVDMDEEDAPVGVKETVNPINYVSPPKEQEEEVLEQRKSKRLKIAPVGLMDHKCDTKVAAGFSIMHDLDHRFQLMEQSLATKTIITFPSGYSVSPGEFSDLAHRKTTLPTGV
ncbi:hypothetical protein Bca52824_001530 [Brassica carinata]|uniref:DUF1985 domain-containing protein n=1 Tax=Brassica carinata TaxID=52824 RepID=A0A8X7WJK2_BRACI|nr:hypothetical protein Bca52824_001530 [Brassica carinata]